MVAKFKCAEVTKTSDGYRIKMYPVTSGSPENEKFFKYTPSGVIEIGTINQLAIEAFEPGKEYFVNFTEAPSGT